MGKIADLGKYEKEILKLVKQSSLAFPFDEIWHSNFEVLYKLVRTARNDALHQGAIARHLTESAVKLSLIIEDALQQEAKLMNVSDYMVRNPICASLWQPLSFVRQQMLINSFSFLPFKDNDQWWFISDYGLATYFNSCDCETQENKKENPRCERCRKERLAQTLDNARSKLNFLPAEVIYFDDKIEVILDKVNNEPKLVFDNSENSNLVGIITPFDIL